MSETKMNSNETFLISFVPESTALSVQTIETNSAEQSMDSALGQSSTQPSGQLSTSNTYQNFFKNGYLASDSSLNKAETTHTRRVIRLRRHMARLHSPNSFRPDGPESTALSVQTIETNSSSTQPSGQSSTSYTYPNFFNGYQASDSSPNEVGTTHTRRVTRLRRRTATSHSPSATVSSGRSSTTNSDHILNIGFLKIDSSISARAHDSLIITRKRRRELHASNEAKKRKITQNSLVDGLKKLGFYELENIIQCTFNPNENVAVTINIREATELSVRIYFHCSHEIVDIQDKSFGSYPINLKIQRLKNLQNNLKHLRSRKEEMFADIQNWEKFTKSTDSSDSSKSVNSARNRLSNVMRPQIRSARKTPPSVVPLKNAPKQTFLVPPGYPSLSEGILNQIHKWMNTNPSEFIMTKFGNVIYISEIQRLLQEFCLDDQNINSYFDLIYYRDCRYGKRTLYAMKAHFFVALRDGGYDIAKSMVGNVDILQFDKVLIPIHHSRNHWGLAVIYPKQKQIEYYDSLSKNINNNNNDNVLAKLKEYIKFEGLNRHVVEIDTSQWTMQNITTIPQQQNNTDCGVFVCAYAESIARNQCNFVFTHEHMPYFRNRIAYEIGTREMLNNFIGKKLCFN